MSEEGQDLMEHLQQKYGKAAIKNFGDPKARLNQMGEAVGIKFNSNRRMVNTIRAHALVEAVKKTISNDTANKLMEHMYELYFVQGKDISDTDVLMEAAKQVANMDPKDAALAMETGANDVRVQDRTVKSAWGVSGVPFYVIQPNDPKRKPVSFSGAYPPDIIAEELVKAAEQ